MLITNAETNGGKYTFLTATILLEFPSVLSKHKVVCVLGTDYSELDF